MTQDPPFRVDQRVWHIGHKDWPGATVQGTATVIRVTRAKVGFTVVVKPDYDRSHSHDWFSANVRRVRPQGVSR